MPEQIPFSPDQQHNTAQQILHTAELLQGGASINALGSLAITSGQYDTLHAQMEDATTSLSEIALAEMPQPATTSFSELAADAMRQPAAVEEDISSQELLSDIVERSGVAVDNWFDAGVVRQGGVRFLKVVSEGVAGQAAESVLSVGTDPKAYQGLNERGVSEIVTFSRVRNRRLISARLGRQAAAGEEAVVLTYEQTGRSKQSIGSHKKFTAGARDGGGSLAQLKYQMLLTTDDAVKLEAAIIENPELLHSLTNTVLVEKLEANEKRWEETGPQYDAWRELSDDGQNRIAIRRSLDAPLEDSQIVAY